MPSKLKLVAAGVLIAGLAACQPAASDDADTATEEGASQMGDEAKIAVVRDMVDAWNTRDWDRVVNLFAEDGSLHSMMVEPIVGREAIGARIGHLGEGLETITLNLRNIGVIDGTVFVERVDEFVYNGHEGSVPVVGVIEIGEDGLITEWREYYDRAELLQAMGLAEDFDQAGRE
jgi:limonene-1,2-epoxide hydrolase